MKKIFFILIVIAGSQLMSNGQTTGEAKVKWYTIKEALDLEKKEPRKIIIDVYTDWCGWCKRMDKETFDHPVIAAYLNQHFYPVKFNAETTDSIIFGGHKFINQSKGRGATHQFAMALFQAQNIQPGYPSIAYLDENLQLIKVWSGFWTAPQIEVWLNYVIDEKYKPLPLEEYQKTFVSKIKQ